jgi:hypothetical protein
VDLASADLGKTTNPQEVEPGADPLVLEKLESAVEVAQADRDATEEYLADILAKAQTAIRISAAPVPVNPTAELTPEDQIQRVLASGTDPLQVSLTASQFAKATANLKKAETDVADVQGAPDLFELPVRQRKEFLARATWEEASEDLWELTEDIDPLKTQRQRALTAVGEARYNEAATRLKAVQNRLPREVELRQANVSLSRGVVSEALENYQGAILKAPFAGVISLVNVEPDDEVTRDSRIVEIVDPTVLEVESFVNASNAKLISSEARATVTIENFPDYISTSSDSSVSNNPRTERGIISYSVTIAVDVPSGTEVPVGLSGVTVVINLNEKGVLLAPHGTVGGAIAGPCPRSTRPVITPQLPTKNQFIYNGRLHRNPPNQEELCLDWAGLLPLPI